MDNYYPRKRFTHSCIQISSKNIHLCNVCEWGGKTALFWVSFQIISWIFVAFRDEIIVVVYRFGNISPSWYQIHTTHTYNLKMKDECTHDIRNMMNWWWERYTVETNLTHDESLLKQNTHVDTMKCKTGVEKECARCVLSPHLKDSIACAKVPIFLSFAFKWKTPFSPFALKTNFSRFIHIPIVGRYNNCV